MAGAVEKWIRITEAANRSGLSAPTLRRLVAAKTIPCSRPTPRSILIREADLESFIKRGQERQSA